MGNIGGGEILVILLVALLVLGPDKLPEVARQLGKAMAEMRKISAGFQREIQDAMRVPDDPKPATAAVTPAESVPAEATDTFLTTEPAALIEPTAPVDDAALVQSVEAPATNEAGEPAAPTAVTDLTDSSDSADLTDSADTFLTTEPAAMATDIVTPPEAPPLPSDAALGGDR